MPFGQTQTDLTNARLIFSARLGASVDWGDAILGGDANWAKIVYDSVAINTQTGFYDGATGAFTPQALGSYVFHVTAGITGISASGGETFLYSLGELGNYTLGKISQEEAHSATGEIQRSGTVALSVAALPATARYVIALNTTQAGSIAGNDADPDDGGFGCNHISVLFFPT